MYSALPTNIQNKLSWECRTRGYKLSKIDAFLANILRNKDNIQNNFQFFLALQYLKLFSSNLRFYLLLKKLSVNVVSFISSA